MALKVNLSGPQSASGMPVEAVVRDLCDTRKHLEQLIEVTGGMAETSQKIHTAVKDGTDKADEGIRVAEQNSQILKEVKTAIDGVKKAIQDLTEAVTEDTKCRREDMNAREGRTNSSG